MWYYSNNGDRSGPVSQFAIRSLYEQRAIAPDTLVWQEGMETWQPLHATTLAGFLKVPLPGGDTWETCAFSGDRYRQSEMVQVEGLWIGNDRKDEAVELLKQGGRLPVVELDSPFKGNLDLGHLLRYSWKLLQPCLPSSILLYLLVWVPGNLAINYIGDFVLTEEQGLRIFQVSSWVQSLWGNIATGGVLFLLSEQIRGRTESLGSAFGAGLANWGRVWVASFLIGLMTILGLLLLILPGFIAITRTSFATAAAVDGKMSGSSAVQESWDVTKGHFWRVLGYMLLMGMVSVAPSIFFGAFSTLVPWLEHWVVNALLGTLFELPVIYMLAFTLVFYKEIKARPVQSISR